MAIRSLLLLLVFVGMGRTSAQDDGQEGPQSPEPAKRFRDQPLHRFDVKSGTIHPLQQGESIADFTETKETAQNGVGAPTTLDEDGGQKQTEQTAKSKDENRDPSRVVIASARSARATEAQLPQAAEVALLRIHFKALSSFKLNRPFRSAVVQFPWVYALDRDGGLYWFKLDETSGIPQSVVTTYFRDSAGDGKDLAIIGDTLVCTRGNRLAVYSLSDPSSPSETQTVGPTQTPRRSRGVIIYGSRGIIVNGRRIYLLYGSRISTFEVHGPGNIVYQGSADVEGNCLAACFVGSTLYCALDEDREDWTTKIVGLDVSDPLRFKPLGNCQFTGYPYHLIPLDSETIAALFEGEARVPAVDGNTISFGHSGWVQLFTSKDGANLAAVGRPLEVHARAAAPLGQDLVVTTGHVYRRSKEQIEPVFDFYLGTTLDAWPYHGHGDGKYAALPTDDSVTILNWVAPTPMDEPLRK